jgi:hypothetical protein
MTLLPQIFPNQTRPIIGPCQAFPTRVKAHRMLAPSTAAESVHHPSAPDRSAAVHHVPYGESKRLPQSLKRQSTSEVSLSHLFNCHPSGLIDPAASPPHGLAGLEAGAGLPLAE